MLGKVTPKEVYLYSKLSMLENMNYCQTALGRTPTSHVTEMTRQTIANTIDGLKNKGFISVSKQRLDGNSYDSNIYTLLSFEGYFKGVYNDFINLETIDANTKGFAILLHLYGKPVTSYTSISKATGISDKSCKKYMETLEAAGILLNGELIEKYFPRLAKESLKREFDAKVEELTSIEFNEATKAYISRCIDNLIKQLADGKITYKFAIERLTAIAAGLYWIKKDNNETTETITL